MADTGEDREKGKPGRRRGGRKKGKPEKKARKARSGQGKNPGGKLRADLISAIHHPLRRRILRLLHDRGEVLSPVQIAKELDVSLSTTAYHVRVLAKFRALAPAGDKQVLGALQRFYASTIEDDPPVEALLEETREVDEEEGRVEKDK